MEIRIGCSGWQYDEWKEVFYPKTLAKKQWFEFYVQHFDTVELNYPFYRMPSEVTVERWYQQAPKDFRYSIKVNRAITHYKKFEKTERLLKDFYALTDLLKEKLGCILFQFPGNLHYKEETLKKIISQLDTTKRNVLEFRHASWWQAEVYETMQDAGITFCIVDALGIPNNFVKTSDLFYMRLHGETKWYVGNYSKHRLKQIAEWVRKNQFKECWIYFDNTANGDAPRNSLELLEIFK